MEDTYVRLIKCRLHLFRSSASSFSSQYLLLFLKSSRSCVLLLPTPFTSDICPSMASWRTQFLLRIWRIQLTFLRRMLLDRSYSEKKLPPSWCHWRTDDGSERSRKKKKQLLDDLRNRRRYWELKEEAEYRKKWRRQFISWTKVSSTSPDLLTSRIPINQSCHSGHSFTVSF